MKIILLNLFIELLALSYKNYAEGGKTPYIIRGIPAKEGQFPFQVLIYPYHDIYGPLICSGMVFNENYVLTAAHCVKDVNPTKIDLYFGVLNRKDLHKSVYRGVSKVISHEDHEDTPFNNDIALLKLNKPIEFSELIKPVTLPKPKEEFTSQTITVSGWGTTENGQLSEVLLYTYHSIKDDEICEKEILPKEILCSISSDGISQACSGDSGGPVVLNGTNVLVGIVNSGYTNCIFGIFYSAKVSHHIEWIEKHIE